MKAICPALCAIAVLPLYAADYKLFGPHSHENLSIYLIHGAEQSSHRYLTLREALDQKKAVVYETGNVNELTIENLSKTEEIFIQSGDIVKGGKQDRTLKDDLVIPTSSGRIPLISFCVEHGRWTGRGTENAALFNSAPQTIATREVKMAVQLAANQAEVWDQVAVAQRKLSKNLSGSVASPASPSSFMLSLESPPVQKAVQEYVKAFSRFDVQANDVIGIVFAVNGKVSSADVYASHALFVKLWPSLLRASAVEAIAETRHEAKTNPPSLDSVRALMAEAERGRQRTRDRNTIRETATSAMFETRDRAGSGTWIHRGYITK